MIRRLSDDGLSPAGSAFATPEFDDGVCLRRNCSIVAEADHRIANHLAMLATHLRLRAGEVAKRPTDPSRDSVRLLLLSIDAEISAVARLHRLLSARGPQASADLGAQLHEICAAMNSGLSDAVVIEDLPQGFLVDADQALPITQIVTEIITNAVKHAARGGGASVVLVRARRGEGGAVVVEIVDRGPGFPPCFDPRTSGGLGFRLVRTLAAQMGATVTFHSSEAGVRFELALPAAVTAISA